MRNGGVSRAAGAIDKHVHGWTGKVHRTGSVRDDDERCEALLRLKQGFSARGCCRRGWASCRGRRRWHRRCLISYRGWRRWHRRRWTSCRGWRWRRCHRRPGHRVDTQDLRDRSSNRTTRTKERNIMRVYSNFQFLICLCHELFEAMRLISPK